MSDFIRKAVFTSSFLMLLLYAPAIGQGDSVLIPETVPGPRTAVTHTMVHLDITMHKQVDGEKNVDQDHATRGGTERYWQRESGPGQDEDSIWTYVNDSMVNNYMIWRSGLASGKYEVFVYIPSNNATTRGARYRVGYFRGHGWNVIDDVIVSQNDNRAKWVSLGSYKFPGEPAVFLGDNTGEPYCTTKRKVGFDSVNFIGSGAIR